MKEQKSKKSKGQNKKTSEFNIQEGWKNLDPVNQEIVTNFFNAHNLAHLLYSLASYDGKQYISNCIRLQNIADKAENEDV